MAFADALKRAARYNPAWRPAAIYAVAKDIDGKPLTDGAGQFQYDLVEETYGHLDLTKEENFTISEDNYTGASLIKLITGRVVDDRYLILMDGLFYQVLAVDSADVLGATIRLSVSAIPDGEEMTIRDDEL